MRKSFIILSSSVKMKRLRKMKSSTKSNTRPILGRKRSASRSVVIISDDSKEGHSNQQSGFGPTQRALVYDDTDSGSPAHGKRRKTVKGRKEAYVEGKEGHTKDHKGKKNIAVDSSGCGSKRKRGKKNIAEDNSGNGMQRNRVRRADVTATSSGRTLQSGKKKISEESVKGEARKQKEVGNEQAKVPKARKRAKKDEFSGIRTRSAPLQFYKCVRALTDQQREAVREMGFGRLLTFSVDGLPAMLGSEALMIVFVCNIWINQT